MATYKIVVLLIRPLFPCFFTPSLPMNPIHHQCSLENIFISSHSLGPLPETCTKNCDSNLQITSRGAPFKDKTAVGVADFFIYSVLSSWLAWHHHITSGKGIFKSTFKVILNSFMHLNHLLFIILFSCLLKLTGIEHRISSPYHPQTNGLNERTNQTLTRALIKFSEAKENWDESIDAALYALSHSKAGFFTV